MTTSRKLGRVMDLPLGQARRWPKGRAAHYHEHHRPLPLSLRPSAVHPAPLPPEGATPLLLARRRAYTLHHHKNHAPAPPSTAPHPSTARPTTPKSAPPRERRGARRMEKKDYPHPPRRSLFTMSASMIPPLQPSAAPPTRSPWRSICKLPLVPAQQQSPEREKMIHESQCVERTHRNLPADKRRTGSGRESLPAPVPRIRRAPG